VRVLVVGNPRATETTAQQRDILAHSLVRGAELEIAETNNRGHAAALACRAMRDRVDVVVALGGDGTVNEVVNGLLTDGVHPDVPALGVVPSGSTNVFARALGLPNDPAKATARLLEGLRTGARRHVSLGKVDDRWFVFAAGVGYDAAIIASVEQHRRRGKRSTHRLYARVAVREFVRYDRRHPKLTVELPDGTVLDNVFFAIVANTDPWTFVGNRPLRPTPEASFETGLDIYARRRMSMPGVLYSMVGMARSRPRIGRRGAAVQHDLSGLVVRCEQPLPLQVDGDLLEAREKMQFYAVPQAISVVVP
jgi:diacylglycerol kinase family enzyme